MYFCNFSVFEVLFSGDGSLVNVCFVVSVFDDSEEEYGFGGSGFFFGSWVSYDGFEGEWL